MTNSSGSSSNADNHASPSERLKAVSANQHEFHHIAACLDASGFAEKVVPHALAIAAATGSPLTFLRVVEAKATRPIPLDPVEWDLHLREAEDEMKRLAEERRQEAYQIETQVIEGEAAEQISHWGRDHHVELTVLCSHGDSGISEWGLGSTAQKLLDRVHGSLLLVPCTSVTGHLVHYHRLLVPLDGSSHAESVIPLATRLASAQGAELVLAHIVPTPELTEVGPLETDAIELRDQLIRRNERAAYDYLDRIRAHVDGGLSVRTRLVRGADVRSGLRRTIMEEQPDLVVLTAHGHGRRADVPFGSVAAHLITHTTVPLLIVRRRATHLTRQDETTGHDAPVRLPSHAR